MTSGPTWSELKPKTKNDDAISVALRLAERVDHPGAPHAIRFISPLGTDPQQIPLMPSVTLFVSNVCDDHLIRVDLHEFSCGLPALAGGDVVW